jgi:ankyrin repeat protein
MKRLQFAVLAGALAFVSAPVIAQVAGGYDGIQFVEAVHKKEGNKIMEFIRSHGPHIVDSKGPSGNTALIVAISDRNDDYTAFLLNQGADPNLAGKGGDTPLIAAARAGSEDAAEWLLGQGAKIDGTNKMGETALIIAVQQRNLPMAKMLLSNGANPEKTDNAAGLSARNYAERDGRSRDILQLMQSKKPAATPAATR